MPTDSTNTLKKISLKSTAKAFKPSASKASVAAKPTGPPVAVPPPGPHQNPPPILPQGGMINMPPNYRAPPPAPVAAGYPSRPNNGPASSLAQSTMTRPTKGLNTAARVFSMKKSTREFRPSAKATPAAPTNTETAKTEAAPKASTTTSSLGKPTLSKGSRSFKPKGLSQTVDPTSRPPIPTPSETSKIQTSAVEKKTQETPKEDLKEVAKEEEEEIEKTQESTTKDTSSPTKDSSKVPEASKEAEDEAKVEERKTKVDEKSNDPIAVLTQAMKETKKLPLEAFLAFRDNEMCTCQDEEPSFANPIVLNRPYEERQSDAFRKGRKGNYNNSHHKGGYGGRNNHNNYNQNHKRGGRNHGRHNDRHGKGNFRGNQHGGGLVRNPISEETKEMKEQASKLKDRLKNIDKGNVELRAKAILNKITPDNIKSQKSEFYKVLKDCSTSDERQKVVKIIFRKATFEEKYVSMYASLIKYLGETEYDEINNPVGEESKGGKSAARKAKDSPLKKEVVEECKACFYEFFEEMKIDDVKEEDREEFTYKYKKRLFGNLTFIAELYKKKLVGINVPIVVLRTLLGQTDEEFGQKANEFTVEGACTFLKRVGSRLDKATKSKSKKGGEESPTKKKSEKHQETFENMLVVLKGYEDNEYSKSRVGYLIKNTLEMRESNWENKDIKEGPKTKKQIKKDHQAAMRGDDDLHKSPSKMNKKHSVKKGGFGELAMQKTESSMSIMSESDNYNIPKPVEKEYSPREMEHMDHEAIKDRFIGNFVEWIQTSEYNLEMFNKPENKTPKSKILEFLLDKLYDKEEKDVKKFPEYFFHLFEKKMYAKKDIEVALTAFFKTIPDIEADFPHLANLYSDLLYFIFVEKDIADFRKVHIKIESGAEGEEPDVFIEIYFKIFAALLTKIQANLGDDKLAHYFTQFKVSETCKMLKPYILEDGLFDEMIEQGIPEKVVSLVNVATE
ncbi:unnamed protein product [Moneuplotes crassus]|uniref:MIF4G domain-containing protein n=1 Tax=Euplotes crassus TaxID=5936 RepID=A0AAD2D2V9_EUPCR|nr:unnamed protein product [Moneuplotes crassus]